jgi:predicted ester cyclase
MNYRSHHRTVLLPLSAFVKVGLLLAVMLKFISVSVYAQSAAPACEGDQLENIRGFGLTFVRAMNDGNLGEWYIGLADDYQLHSSMVDFVPLDRDGARAAMQALLSAFPGFQSEIHMSLVSADCRYVTYYWTSRGTFTGPYGDMQPTGNAWVVSGINIAEVENGEIVQEWNTFDRLTLMTQLGVLGGAATPEATAATGS